MANFNDAIQLIIKNEGGYVNDPIDPGGETYKGISRKAHSKWEGWVTIDLAKQQANFPKTLESDQLLQDQIHDFYRVLYWDKLKGDEITNQAVAESIFDFAVNAGTATSTRLAQMVAGANADGIMGPKSLEKINAFDPGYFLSTFALAKIARYVNIVKKNPSTNKFFYGWVRRTLGDRI